MSRGTRCSPLRSSATHCLLLPSAFVESAVHLAGLQGPVQMETPGTDRHSPPPGLAVSNEQISVCPGGRIIICHVPPESFLQVATMFLSDGEDGIRKKIVGSNGSS